MADIYPYISKPCNVNWQKMTPDAGGKYCSVCSKTVVDFTAMETEEIKTYFQTYSSHQVCGRFKTAQLKNTGWSGFLFQTRKKAKQLRFMPLRYVALLLTGLALVVSGCRSHTKGKVRYNEPAKTKETTDTTQKPVILDLR